MSPVRLKRRRVVTDLSGAERVLIEDTPLPRGWREGAPSRRRGGVVEVTATTTAPAPAGNEPAAVVESPADPVVSPPAGEPSAGPEAAPEPAPRRQRGGRKPADSGGS